VPRRDPSATIAELKEASKRPPTVIEKEGFSGERQLTPSSAPTCGTNCQ
jgi:hypothetical protein